MLVAMLRETETAIDSWELSDTQNFLKQMSWKCSETMGVAEKGKVSSKVLKNVRRHEVLKEVQHHDKNYPEPEPQLHLAGLGCGGTI